MTKYADPASIGYPLTDHIQEQMKDPEYRKGYMRIQIRISLANIVRSLRELRGLTQKQLAERAGIPQSQVARLEGVKDERIPSLELLVKIFAALDTHATLGISPSAEGPAKRHDIVLL